MADESLEVAGGVDGRVEEWGKIGLMDRGVRVFVGC